jgi:hypothetical protein
MTNLPAYSGDDPLLRWYADNGTGWLEARFANNALEFLRWHEVVAGTPYEVIIDRLPEANALRLLVDVSDIVCGVVVDEKSEVIRARCPLTRRIRVGDAPPDHKITAFTQGGAFFVVSACGSRRLGVGTAFFTDPRTSGERARGLATQIIETARKIVTGARGDRKPADTLVIGDDGAKPSVFVDCMRWPWRL